MFRSPFVQSPIPGRPATLLVLTTVVQIFENFRYHRTFVGGSHDAALEFSANIGKWQLKGVDLIKFGETGEMIEFEVMVRPIKALAALGEEMGNRIGPQLSLLKAAAGRQADCGAFGGIAAGSALAPVGALWQGSARLVGAFLADSRKSGMLP